MQRHPRSRPAPVIEEHDEDGSGSKSSMTDSSFVHMPLDFHGRACGHSGCMPARATTAARTTTATTTVAHTTTAARTTTATTTAARTTTATTTAAHTITATTTAV